MSSLLDFLQAASNSAASNVSAPVDAIAWLLKKAGIDVGTPVGGSDWMARQGLTRPVQQSGASLAGETAGLFAPIAAAAKAPQIARGLLQGAENMAAPRTLRPDQGAIVWHGSPHKFDRFDSSKIGTGEGAQAYGHGLYMADAPEVAATYRTAGSDAQYSRFSGGMTPMEEYAFDRAAAGASGDNLFSQVWSRYGKNIKSDADMDALAAAVRKAEQGSGSLYKVDLPDSAIARMLDWDKPLSQQAAGVQKAFSGFPGAMSGGDAYRAKSYGVDPVGFSDAGRALFDGMAALRGRNPAAASESLRNAGIPGVRYLDGGSRGAGAGSSNFVVFPGEENMLSILERNGLSIR